MIRDAVLHLNNEQPLLADLFELPRSTDTGLICTNLRTSAGTRPIFVDRIDSVFFFPYNWVRFVEIPPGSRGAAALLPGSAEEPETVEPEGETEIDEDFLRRVREA